MTPDQAAATKRVVRRLTNGSRLDVFMSGGSSVAASNAATIMSNSIVNASSIAAHIGFADAAESTASKHSVDGFTMRTAVEDVAVGVHANAAAPRPVGTKTLDRYRGGDESAKAGFLSMISAKRAVAGQSPRAASASKQVTQLRNAGDVGGGHVGFPNCSVSSCKNALLAAVRYAPLRSKTAAVRVGRGGSSGTGCRPSCTRAM